MNAIEQIKQHVKAHQNPVASLWLELGATDLETQVVFEDGCEPAAHKRIDDEYTDYPLAHEPFRVGSTGRNWVDGRSLYIFIDVDHRAGHKGGGHDDDALDACIKARPSYMTLYRSKSGKGLGGIVQFREPKPVAPTREAHTHVGARVRQKLANDGFPVEYIDVIGGNGWFVAGDAEPGGYTIIAEATEKLTVDDLPEVERSAVTGDAPPAEAPRKLIEFLRARGWAADWQPEHGCLHTHTAGLAEAAEHFDLPAFVTNSAGSDPKHSNCFLSPDGELSGHVARFNNAAEHPAWTGRFGLQTFEEAVGWEPEVVPDLFAPIPVAELIEQHPDLAEPVIEGLLRRGETANIIAPPKVGKSWLVYGIALSIAAGGMWLDHFNCHPGRVLLIDNELHPATLAHRIPQVAKALGVSMDNLDVISLRGRLIDLKRMKTEIVSKIEHGKYAAIIVDAWYRVLPTGSGGENDNAAMAEAYNLVDQFAARTDAAWILIHHSSKGNQSEKSVTDVGAGAGSQSRAADIHVVLRPHEQPEHFVLEAVVRSWAQVEPMTLRWEFPVWRATDLDTNSLATSQSTKQRRNDDKGRATIHETLKEEPNSVSGLRRRTGMSRDRIEKLIQQLMQDGVIASTVDRVRGNETQMYHVTT